jgi:hypothetical protein
MNTETNKICKKCWLILPNTSEFFSIVTNKSSNWESYTIMRWSCKKCQVKWTRTWQKDNPDKFHANEKKRQDLLKNAIWSFTNEDIVEIRAMQDNKCYYCWNELDFKQQKDHKIPLSKWWTNFPSNLVLACHTCNLDKHGKSVNEFFERRIKCNLPINSDFYNIE